MKPQNPKQGMISNTASSVGLDIWPTAMFYGRRQGASFTLNGRDAIIHIHALTWMTSN